MKTILTFLVIGAISIALIGASVPKTEYYAVHATGNVEAVNLANRYFDQGYELDKINTCYNSFDNDVEVIMIFKK